MKSSKFENVGHDVKINEGKNITTAEQDIVGGDKTVINNYYSTEKNSGQNYAPDSSFLPYLLDREEQEEDLINAIEKHEESKHPLLCIVHGTADNCCSDKYIERVRIHSLSKHPKTHQQIKDFSPPPFMVEVGAFKNKAQMHSNMRSCLGGEFVKNSKASPEQISAAFYKEQRLILLHSTLSTQDCLRCDGIQTLQHFLDFWQNWQPHDKQKHLILVFLHFYYEPYKRSLFDRLLRKRDFNKDIENALATLNFAKLNLHGTVVRKPPLIEKTHIREWAQSPEIRNFFQRSIYEELREDVEQIYQRHKTEALALGHISKELKVLLKQLQHR